jgi:hypothetical protein
MAQNFMSVAERLGPKTEIIANLTIQPTAAYLLAAPSVPAGVQPLFAPFDAVLRSRSASFLCMFEHGGLEERL